MLVKCTHCCAVNSENMLRWPKCDWCGSDLELPEYAPRVSTFAKQPSRIGKVTESVKSISQLVTSNLETLALDDVITAVIGGAPIPKYEIHYASPVRGNIVFAVRIFANLFDLYRHYGIYVGKENNEDKVIHFSYHKNESKKDVRIIKTSLKEFSDGDPTYIEGVDPAEPANTNEQTAQIAEQHLGRFNNGWSIFTPNGEGYSVTFHNCEHFVNYCKYNENKALQPREQVEGFCSKIVSSVGAGVSSAVLGVAGLAYMFYRFLRDERIYRIKQIKV